MKNKEPRPLKRKLLNSYFVSTLSIAMLLFLVGLLSFMIFNAKYINDYIRENIGFTIVLDEEVREVDLLRLQKLLAVQPEVKSAVYIDAHTAAQELQSELGEDFVGFLGYNPLHASIDVKLYAAYTHNDSLAVLEHKFMEFSNVQEVYYQRNLVNLINENTNKIGIVLIVLGGVMLLIFIALMNNTIRLSIYSKRFIINTMQLVGATRSFIRKPFVGNSVLQGLIGAFLANVVLFALISSFNSNFNEVYSVSLINVIAPVLGIVFVLGFLISWLSTRFAVNKFLRLSYDELFN